MAGKIFKKIFKEEKRPRTISEVDKCVTKKMGHKLKVAYVTSDLCSSRGSIFAIKDIKAEDELDKIAKRRARFCND